MSKSDYDPREADGLLTAVKKRNLGNLIERRGLTRYGVAAMIGKDKSIVGKWVNGTRRMSNTDLLLTAKALDVSPLYLLDLTRDEWPNDLRASYTDCHMGPTVGRAALSAYLSCMSHDDYHLGQLVEYDKYDRTCITVGGYTFHNGTDGWDSATWKKLNDVDRDYLSKGEFSGSDYQQWLRDRGAVVRELLLERFEGRHDKDGWVGDYRDLRKLSRDAIDFYLDEDKCFMTCSGIDLLAKSVTEGLRFVEIAND